MLVLTIVPYTCRVVFPCPELSGRSVNGICTLVHQANFSEGGFAKLVPIPTFFFFFFFFFCLVVFFGRVGGLLPFSFSFFHVKGVLGRGRRNAMVALDDFMSSSLTL